MIAVNQVSNALGIVNPLEEIIAKTRKLSNAYVLIDGAQSAPHFKIDVQKMDCDFCILRTQDVRTNGNRDSVWERICFWKTFTHSTVAAK